jgi:pimeloyl-ACP methyl ester carboxylesterase
MHISKNMANASPASGMIHPRLPDGTITAVRHYVPERNSRIACLLLPDLGESSVVYEGLGKLLAEAGAEVYAPDLRGHAMSEGTWSLSAQRADIAAWIHVLRVEHERVVIVASGLHASLLLELEEQAHEMRSIERPDLPDGLVLLEPLLNGVTIRPRGAGALLTDRFGECRDLTARARAELSHFRLGPVRVQTPTVLFVKGSLVSDDPQDVLKRIFGNVKVFRAPWISPTTRVERIRAEHEIARSVVSLSKAEQPIRFRSKR